MVIFNVISLTKMAKKIIQKPVAKEIELVFEPNTRFPVFN